MNEYKYIKKIVKLLERHDCQNWVHLQTKKRFLKEELIVSLFFRFHTYGTLEDTNIQWVEIDLNEDDYNLLKKSFKDLRSVSGKLAADGYGLQLFSTRKANSPANEDALETWFSPMSPNDIVFENLDKIIDLFKKVGE